MRNPRFWSTVSYLLAGLTLLALLLPQFRVLIWDNGRSGYLYVWGGHTGLGTSVAGSLYVLAILWGVAGAGGLFLAARRLRETNRSAIAWMNWSAFFIAMELIFLLTIAEEVLTDLRVALLHADSYASFGSWMSFVVFFILLFLPARIKKLIFQPEKATGSAS